MSDTEDANDEQLVLCGRCRGIGHIDSLDLLPNEKQINVDEYSRRAVCPTCAKYGKFGYVPFAVGIEGALLKVSEVSAAEKARADWFRDIMS